MANLLDGHQLKLVHAEYRVTPQQLLLSVLLLGSWDGRLLTAA